MAAKRSRKTNSKTTKQFSLNDLNPEERSELLEEFSSKFLEYLKDAKMKVTELMSSIVVPHNNKIKLASRHYGLLLRALHEDGYLITRYRHDKNLEHDLRDTFNDKNVTVVTGSDINRFARAGAKRFVNNMVRISESKNASAADPLNIGIVSGRTTALVISKAIELDWSGDFGVDVSLLSNINVFALNGCLNNPEHLEGNSSVLSFRLAQKVRDELQRAGVQFKVEAYGLTAPLAVSSSELEAEDRSPQTVEVLRFTDPCRISDKQENTANTELDIVLTGVGEIPQTKSGPGSIFFDLAKRFNFDIEYLKNERIVGDIGFVPIKATGEQVALRKHENGCEIEYFFYSAIRPEILEWMSGQKNKAVILVARNSISKVPAIFASMAGSTHRYASELVVDEKTANALNRF